MHMLATGNAAGDVSLFGPWRSETSTFFADWVKTSEMWSRLVKTGPDEISPERGRQPVAGATSPPG